MAATMDRMPSTHYSLADLERAWVSLIRRGELPSVAEHLNRDSGVDVSRPAYVALSRLYDLGPQLISELAAGAGVDVSTMSRTLKHLDERGLVQREKGADLRCTHMHVTDAGRETVLRRRAAGQRLLANVLDGWSETDRQELSRLIVRLAGDFAEHVERLNESATIS